MTLVAANESTTVVAGSNSNVLPYSVALDGTVVTPATLTIVTPPSTGTASVVGTNIVYNAAAGSYGIDSLTYSATYSAQTSNTATITVGLVAADCTELGRTTRQYVTAYNLNRPQIVRARRYAKRCFVFDFNGALASGALITTARFDCSGPWAGYMSNARIIDGQRKAAIDVEFNFAGWTGLLCTVTLDNGEAYNAEFSVTVTDTPLYPRAVYNTANGPFVLTVSA